MIVFPREVYAWSNGSGVDGTVSVTATGAIVTGGNLAEDFFTHSAGGPGKVGVAAVSTSGANADAVQATSNGPDLNGAVSVTVSGAVTTTVGSADGVRVDGQTAHVAITSAGSVGAGGVVQSDLQHRSDGRFRRCARFAERHVGAERQLGSG